MSTVKTAVPTVGSGVSSAPALLDARKRRPGSGVLCLVLLGVTLAALGHVAIQAKHVEVGLALGKEKELEQKLEDERRHLQIEIARAKNLEHVMTVARTKLDMREPLPTDIRRIGPGVPAALVKPTAVNVTPPGTKAAATKTTAVNGTAPRKAGVVNGTTPGAKPVTPLNGTASGTKATRKTMTPEKAGQKAGETSLPGAAVKPLAAPSEVAVPAAVGGGAP